MMKPHSSYIFELSAALTMPRIEIVAPAASQDAERGWKWIITAKNVAKSALKNVEWLSAKSADMK